MILVITGRDAPHVLHEALGAGADDYLIKPVDSEVLKVRVTIIQQRYEHLAATASDSGRIITLSRTT